MDSRKLEPGMLLRLTANPNDIWRVHRVTEKSAWMYRCDERGNHGPYEPSVWMFRRPTVGRDFHPA
jgi:hypothetical protein